MPDPFAIESLLDLPVSPDQPDRSDDVDALCLVCDALLALSARPDLAKTATALQVVEDLLRVPSDPRALETLAFVAEQLEVRVGVAAALALGAAQV